MKKFFLFFIALLLITSLRGFTQQEEKALIFSIDISRSMLNPPGFYTDFKESIKRYIKNNTQINDLVTIYSFGNDVKIVTDTENFQIKNSQDIEKLIQHIDNLRPTDNKTWLSKAVDVLADKMKSIESQYPGRKIKAYIFTDGINDPPSGVSSLSLADILRKHVKTFDETKNGHAYIITIDAKLDPDSKNIINSTKNISHIETNKIGAEIQIELDKDVIKLKTGDLQIAPKIKILKIQEIETGTLKFMLDTSVELNIETKEMLVPFSANTEEFNLPISFRKSPPAGNHIVVYKIKPYNGSYNITPDSIKINLEIQEGEVIITTETISIETTTEGGKTTAQISGINKTSKNLRLLPIFSPNDGTLMFSGEEINLPKGEFEEKLELTIAQSGAGESQFQLILQPLDQGINIDKSIPVILKITEPFNWSTLLIIVIVIILLLAIYIWCRYIKPKFKFGTLLVFSEGGITTEYDLSQYSSICSNSVSVGLGQKLNIDLADTLLVIKPKSNGAQVKVKEGFISFVESGEEKMLGKPESRLIEDLNFSFKVNEKDIIFKQSL